jgi:hypothetical protein
LPQAPDLPRWTGPARERTGACRELYGTGTSPSKATRKSPGCLAMRSGMSTPARSRSEHAVSDQAVVTAAQHLEGE